MVLLSSQVEDFPDLPVSMTSRTTEKFETWLGENLSWPRRQTWLPKVYQNRPKTETWALTRT